MEERIRVVDSLGIKVGDFVPVAASGAVAGPLAAGCFFALIWLAPVVNLIAPPLLFLWVRQLPKDYPIRKFLVVMSHISLGIWVLGLIVLFFALVTGSI